MALEFFILIIIFAFSSRLYSQTSSTLFENIYIKSFRTLSPGYVSAFFRSTLLSMLSIRNHGMNFMALSFLNSGIIQSRQALGLLSGSYLGVCLAVGVLQIGHPIVLVALVVTLLVLSFLSGTAQFFRISKLFFYFILILVSYSGIITVLNKISLSYFSFGTLESYIHPLVGLCLFSVLLFLIFKNMFTVIGLQLAMIGFLNEKSYLLIFSVILIFILNSIWHLWLIRNSHRETKLVTLLNVFCMITSSFILMIFISIFSLDFYLQILLYSMIIAAVGFLICFNYFKIEKFLFKTFFSEKTRRVKFYSSIYNYPGVLLIELFYQEYKKLFAHVSTTLELFMQKNLHPDDTIEDKIKKYLEISNKVLVELKDLQIKLHEIEKTEAQAEFVFICEKRISAMKSFTDAIGFFNNQSSVVIIENLDFFQKIQDVSSYYLTQLIEKESIETTSVNSLMDAWLIYIRKIEDLRNRDIIDSQLSTELQVESMRLIESIERLK